MKYKVDLQIASSEQSIPNRFVIQRWISKVLTSRYENAELCLRIVDKDEIQQLNAQYRHQDKPTNVLSFPSEIQEDVELDKPFLGDIIICAPIVLEEAQQQDKDITAHWAHLVIHGVLHLLGFDHQTDKEADVMEAIEIKTLKALDFQNPYQDDNNQSNHS